MRFRSQGGIVELIGRRIDTDLTGDVENIAVTDGLVVGTNRRRGLIGSDDRLCHGK